MSLDGGLPEPTRRKALEGLAVAYRRAGEHELALQVAEQLIRYPEFSMVGYESAVIFHERVAKNLDAALQVLTEALSRVESRRCRSLLESRWDRLQQKRLEI
jgi:hypothetical protein